MRNVLLLILAYLIGVGCGVKLAKATAPEYLLADTTWTLPSCPRELTLQDGSRWAPPAWSEPGCKAEIYWTQP